MGSAGNEGLTKHQPRSVIVRWALLSLLGIASQVGALGCAHARSAGIENAPLVPQATQAGHTHVVASGETLYRIAMAEGVSVESIASENAIIDPTTLEVGRALFIPGKRAAERDSNPPATVADSTSFNLSSTQAGGGARLLWPVRGVIFSSFGQRGSEHHDGLDLAAPAGTTIVAAADGTVLFVGEQHGYGRIILVEHTGDLITVYAHNSENLVAIGDHVQRGQPIARVGSTGNATGPHVHFEVRVASRPQDPLAFLR